MNRNNQDFGPPQQEFEWVYVRDGNGRRKATRVPLHAPQQPDVGSYEYDHRLQEAAPHGTSQGAHHMPSPQYGRPPATPSPSTGGLHPQQSPASSFSSSLYAEYNNSMIQSSSFLPANNRVPQPLYHRPGRPQHDHSPLPPPQTILQPSASHHSPQQSDTNTVAMEPDRKPTKIRVLFPFKVDGKEERYIVRLSRPARGEDVDLFRTEDDRSKVHYHVRDKTPETEEDALLVMWYEQVGPKYWNMVIDRFRDMIPAIVDETNLRAALTKSHPCAEDPYSGHKLYKDLFVDGARIRELEVWMYGKTHVGGAVPEPLYPTWRQTLEAKWSKETQLDHLGQVGLNVPWVEREELVGVWILLKRARPENSVTAKTATKKWEQLKRCRLTHLVPDPDSAAPDPFWAGIEEALREELEEGIVYR